MNLSFIFQFQLFTEMAIPLHPPACDHENIAHRNGPKWMWWSIQLIPMATSLKLQIISITDIRQRLDKIEEYFDENTSTM